MIANKLLEKMDFKFWKNVFGIKTLVKVARSIEMELRIGADFHPAKR